VRVHPKRLRHLPASDAQLERGHVWARKESDKT
jgi:hypothetical protein